MFTNSEDKQRELLFVPRKGFLVNVDGCEFSFSVWEGVNVVSGAAALN